MHFVFVKVKNVFWVYISFKNFKNRFFTPYHLTNLGVCHWEFGVEVVLKPWSKVLGD
jgi:hypothetical protein